MLVSSFITFGRDCVDGSAEPCDGHCVPRGMLDADP